MHDLPLIFIHKNKYKRQVRNLLSMNYSGLDVIERPLHNHRHDHHVSNLKILTLNR